MDAKFSRLKSFVDENNHNHDNSQAWSRAIFSGDLFQTNFDRVQSFFNNRADAPTPSGTDDMQVLLQKGDNDPILPALVRFTFSSREIQKPLQHRRRSFRVENNEF